MTILSKKFPDDKGNNKGGVCVRPLLQGCHIKKDWRIIMLGWALTFLIVAIIAGVLGFGGVAAISVEIAQILFVVFLALFIIAAAVGAFRGRRPPV
jgi:uncharacterized membrane protein YtjA (UPF0391 family)